MGEREEVETLVERSSLGTPDAAAARAGVSDEDAERVMARVRELERVEPLAEQMCAWRGGRWDFIRPEVRERYRSLAAGVLASSWLAAHDERVRAGERERLAGEEDAADDALERKWRP